MLFLFWISFALLFYTYLGYGMLLFILNLVFKKKKNVDDGFQPEVTFIVAAYNEEAVIEKKIKNTLALQYPSDKISFVFITDGSTDATPEVVNKYGKIKLMHNSERSGKSAAINRAMNSVHTPVVVFSDANTLLNHESIEKLVRHYADERVGGVSGEKRIVDDTGSTVGFGERIYWQYESFLKKANADFNTIVGAAGELFSIRTSLFQPLPEDIILDDFVISARVCEQGYRFLYEEEAYGMETSSTSIREERKRKVRISAGCFQALVMLKELLNPFKNARVAFQYFSHRVLRWTICPLLLPLVFVLNFLLLRWDLSPLYLFLFWSQSAFYGLAFAGWLFHQKKISSLLLVPYYFVFMILSQYAGFFRFAIGRQSVLWEKAERKLFRGGEDLYNNS